MKQTLSRSMLAIVLLAAVSCKGGGDIDALKKQGLELVSEYMPKVEGLQSKVTGLIGTIGALKGAAGASDMLSKLTGAKSSLGNMTSLLSKAKESFGGQGESSIADIASVTKLVGSLKSNVGDKLGGITSLISGAEGKIAELKKQATGAATGAAKAVEGGAAH